MDKKKKVILYARVSLIDMNPETQLVTLREYCERYRFAIAGEFVDRVSGRSEDRPALRKALFKLKSNEAEVLVVYSIDRLGRSISHLIRLVDEVRSFKAGILILRESLDLTGSSPQSDLILHLFAALAQFELSLISSRTKLALQVAKLSGKRLGRPSKLNGEIIKRVLDLHEQGVSKREIARRVPEISRASIQKIIKAHKNK